MSLCYCVWWFRRAVDPKDGQFGWVESNTVLCIAWLVSFTFFLLLFSLYWRKSSRLNGVYCVWRFVFVVSLSCWLKKKNSSYILYDKTSIMCQKQVSYVSKHHPYIRLTSSNPHVVFHLTNICVVRFCFLRLPHVRKHCAFITYNLISYLHSNSYINKIFTFKIHC